MPHQRQTAKSRIGETATNITGFSPYYLIVPSYGGLSVYGETAWNSTAKGYAVCNFTPVITSCGASRNSGKLQQLS